MTALHGAVTDHKTGHALLMLVDMVEQRYTGKRAPLMTFAADLEKEVSVLEQCSEQLSTLLTVRSSRDSFKPDYQVNVLQKLELVHQIKQKMKNFMDLVDQILRGLE
jgi:hypothetical protein